MYVCSVYLCVCMYLLYDKWTLPTHARTHTQTLTHINTHTDTTRQTGRQTHTLTPMKTQSSCVCDDQHTHTHTHTHTHAHIHTYTHQKINEDTKFLCVWQPKGLSALFIWWLRFVGSLKLQVSFAEYCLFYRALLQKRPIILRSLLIVATLYSLHSVERRFIRYRAFLAE